MSSWLKPYRAMIARVREDLARKLTEYPPPMDRAAELPAAVAALPDRSIALRRYATYALESATGQKQNPELERVLEVLVLAEAAESAGIPLTGWGDLGKLRDAAAGYDRVHGFRTQAETELQRNLRERPEATS